MTIEIGKANSPIWIITEYKGRRNEYRGKQNLDMGAEVYNPFIGIVIL